MAARVDLLAKVRRALEEPGLVPARGRVLLACSGGADSTAMLDLLARLAGPLGLHLEVATVDHGQRLGSARVARVVERLALERGLRFHGLRLDRRAAPPGSSETRLRDLRLARLADLARRRRLSRVALAHTADDRAESVLLRIARGTGVAGLIGIRAVGPGPFVHPLLGITRREIEAYLRWRGLPWHEDPANRDPRHPRNRVRHDLLPRLAASLNPALPRALLRLARAAERDDACLAELAGRVAFTTRRGRTVLATERLLALHPAVQARVLLRMVARLRGEASRLPADQVEAALARLGRPGRRWRLALGAGLLLSRRDALVALEESGARP